ncbi:MAG TPA: hypothetical protein VKI64_01380 [Acidimicrobiales bacterium]|nr:hypothetical protein [Acidimicrobiales bacterium]
MTGELDRLIALGDLDELTRHVDRLCDAGDWDGLVATRDRARAALDRGKQLWPVASLAEYRLALEAPAAWAGPVVVPGAGRFALGPLPEVAASRHPWCELAPHVPSGPLAAVTAHERVVRGEDLREDPRVDPSILELPLALERWEPTYPVATYHPDRVELPFPRAPEVGGPPPAESNGDAEVQPVEDPEGCRALSELVGVRTTESDGRAEAVAVSGHAADAVRALGISRARRRRIDGAHAMAVMAWCAASGGAHGRRRGMAAGRFAAWWASAALAGMLDAWPLTGADLGQAVAAHRWWLWDAGEPETGWVLRMAVEDTANRRAWALSAIDAA